MLLGSRMAYVEVFLARLIVQIGCQRKPADVEISDVPLQQGKIYTDTPLVETWVNIIESGNMEEAVLRLQAVPAIDEVKSLKGTCHLSYRVKQVV